MDRNETKRCPNCRTLLVVPAMAETCICRRCGEWFHPEQALSERETGPRRLVLGDLVYIYEGLDAGVDAPQVVAVDALLSDESLERVAHAAGRAMLALTRDHRLGLARDMVEAALSAALPGGEAST